jgi:hypothetical protein
LENKFLNGVARASRSSRVMGTSRTSMVDARGEAGSEKPLLGKRKIALFYTIDPTRLETFCRGLVIDEGLVRMHGTGYFRMILLPFLSK